MLGDQRRNGNTWNNAFYTANVANFAARHEGIVNFAGRLPGFFTLAGNNAVQMPATFLFTDPLATPANWFGTDPGATATCPNSTNFVCHYAIPLTNPDSLEFKREIAKGEIETAEFNAEMTKWSKRNLYEELKTQPALVSLDTVLANFKDSLDQSFLSGVYEVAKKREDLTKRSCNEAATIQIERINMETLLGQLTQIDSLARENTANAANTAYYTAQKTQKMAELSVHRNTYESYMDSYKAGVAARALTAKAENTTLVTPELYSQNEKIVNEIYLNRFSLRARKTVNASDAAILTAIANQCPMVGGPAVYYARAMRVRTNRTPYNDAAECALRNVAFRQAKPRKASAANGTARSFTLQPNPAKGSSLIVADQAVADDTAVQLVDMLGRVLHTFTLPKGSSSTALDVSTYPAGVYYCRIGNAATPGQVLRLVIAE